MRTDLPAWRSLLFCPVNVERFVAKAHTRGADAIILDLEDAIAPAEKAAARDMVAASARRVGQQGADVVVRINRPLELAVPDIQAAVCPEVSALMLPKLMGPEHVRLLAELVSAREAAIGMPPDATRFIGLVETAESLPALGAIAVADRRMVALGVGGEDLATDLDAVASPDALELAQRMGLLAARGGGILPLGALVSFADFEDLNAYREGLERSRALGFACTACIHPAQVALVNEAYGADPQAVERARRLLAVFEQALARGEGAVAFEGQMVDLPVAERARRLIARARSYARGKPDTSP